MADPPRRLSDGAAKAGEAIVDLGSPTQTVDGGEPGSYIGGYSIMQAASLDDLQAVLSDHPHKAEGGTIEVLEVLKLPGMWAFGLSSPEDVERSGGDPVADFRNARRFSAHWAPRPSR